jgi:uncharacterized protein YegJ (DUF2314 family)
VVVFSSIFDDDPTLSRLRTGDEMLADLATAQGGFVWDQDTREMFAPDAWQKQRIDGWEGNLPFARRHIAIHQYEFTTGARVAQPGSRRATCAPTRTFGLRSLPMRSSATLLFSSVAAAAVTLVSACHRDQPTVSLKVAARPLDLALYLPAPSSSDLVKQVTDGVRTSFPGIDLHAAPPMGSKPPTALVFAPTIAQFPPPAPDLLAHFTRGLTAAQAGDVSAAKGVVVFSAMLDDDPTFARMRAGEQLFADVATAQKGFVWDQDTREMFSPEAWKKLRLDGWEGNVPFARHHIAIHQYEFTHNHFRAITLGMVKFGLPDLAVDDIAPAQTVAFDWVLGAVAQALVEGVSPDKKGEMVVDLDGLRNFGARQYFLDQAAASADKKVTALKTIAGITPADKLHPAIGRDEELEGVMQRVQTRLPVVADAFQKGLPAGERIEVKAPFDSDDGLVEWIWVDVTDWKAGVLHGTAHGEPRAVKAIHKGQPLELQQAQIADYVWFAAGGARKEGGEAADILKGRHVEAPEP